MKNLTFKLSMGILPDGSGYTGTVHIFEKPGILRKSNFDYFIMRPYNENRPHIEIYRNNILELVVLSLEENRLHNGLDRLNKEVRAAFGAILHELYDCIILLEAPLSKHYYSSTSTLWYGVPKLYVSVNIHRNLII